jgi:molybdopterin synthase catalytic subunit
MIVLSDFQGRKIRLTDERLAHILGHPEMQAQEQRIADTLLAPHSVILSRLDLSVRLYHRLFDETPVTRKYLVVAVKCLDEDAFVITAFFTDRMKKGVQIWPQ